MGMGGKNLEDMDEDERATAEAMRESGGAIPGSRPEGSEPGQGGNTADVAQDQIAAMRAERGGVQDMRFLSVFIDSLIELFESKV